MSAVPQLWKKESPKTDYCDIYDGVRRMEVYTEVSDINFQQASFVDVKNNVLSLKYRNEGNLHYSRNDFLKAMYLYNKGLCFAEIGSVHASFAFANRSSCFLELKMYDECLKDIELARNANYPDHLVRKLVHRTAKCLDERSKNEVKLKSKEPQLSFHAHSIVTSMANVLTIKHNGQYGRHIVAESDIDVEETVFIEKPLVDMLIAGEYSRCTVCMQLNVNFVPCLKCPKAIFCSEDCASNSFHGYECDMFKLYYGWECDGFFRNMLQMIVRLVLFGMNATSTIEELMDITEHAINESNEIAIAGETSLSKFQTLLQLTCFIPTKEGSYETCIQIACLAYDALMSRRSINAIFVTEKHRRFLMHLTFHLTGTFNANRFTILECLGNASLSERFGCGIYNVNSYLNHSCVPNVVCLSYGTSLVCKAIKPIKCGEQLFRGYPDIDVNDITAIRRNRICNDFGFLCSCELCSLSSQRLTSNAAMKADPDFRFVKKHFEKAVTVNCENVLNSLRKRAVQFLKKWGRMQPYKEFIVLKQYYVIILQMLKH